MQLIAVNLEAICHGRLMNIRLEMIILYIEKDFTTTTTTITTESINLSNVNKITYSVTTVTY